MIQNSFCVLKKCVCVCGCGKKAIVVYKAICSESETDNQGSWRSMSLMLFVYVRLFSSMSLNLYLYTSDCFPPSHFFSIMRDWCLVNLAEGSSHFLSGPISRSGLFFFNTWATKAMAVTVFQSGAARCGGVCMRS